MPSWTITLENFLRTGDDLQPGHVPFQMGSLTTSRRETNCQRRVSNVTAEIVAGETLYGTIGYFLVPDDKKSVMRSKDGECRIDQNSVSAFLTSFYEEKTKAGSIRLWPRKVILPEEGREKE